MILFNKTPPVHFYTGKLGDRNITVNCIAPGPFESKMMAVTLER